MLALAVSIIHSMLLGVNTEVQVSHICVSLQFCIGTTCTFLPLSNGQPQTG